MRANPTIPDLTARFTGNVILFSGYFLFLLLYIHPDFIYYAIVNTRDEPFPMFLTGKAFFLSQFGSIGGLSDYFSALLSQSYAISWLGSVVTALLSVGIYYTLRRSIHTGNRHGQGIMKNPAASCEASSIPMEGESYSRLLTPKPASGNAQTLGFIFLPVLVSLCMMNRYELPIPLLVNSFLVLSCVLLYDRFASRFSTSRYWLFPLVCAGLFLMTGRGVLLFSVVTALRTLRTVASSSGKKVFPALPELAITGLILSIMICFLPAVFGKSAGPMPLYYSFTTGYLHIYWYDIAFLASIALYCMLPTVLKHPPLTLFGRALSQKHGSIAGIAIAVLCLYFSHSDWIRNHMRLEYLTHKSQWNEVLKFAEKLPRKDLDVFTVYDVNCALYHTGRLASDMFRFPQSIPALVLPVAPEKSPVSIGLRSALFYFEMGEVNIAQQKLYEVFETSSEHPFVLNKIAETHLVKNQIAAARVVYSRLARDLVYGKHAKALLQKLETDSACDMGDWPRNIRSLVPKNDIVRSAIDAVAICQELLAYDKHNRMAFEYLMALYLLAGDLESFSKNIDRARDFGYAAIPRHWSEALALYIDFIKSGDQRLLELAGEGAIRQVAQFKESFIGTHKEWDLQRLPDYAADLGNLKRLRPAFGATYFYYFFFQQSGLAG